MSSTDPRELAVRYLLATRHADNARAERSELELADLDGAALAGALADDDARVAFWIDVYNAAVVRQANYDFSSLWSRQRFFRRPVVRVAGEALSLDAIEHGILRRSRWKFGLGYAGNPLPSRFERAHRVERVDPRVHFALNCAAASCPPIAAYHAENVGEQLDLATRAFLAAEVKQVGGSTTVPVIFLWFIGDFGGPGGVRGFLRAHGVQGAVGRLRFAGFDWTPAPGRWTADREER